MSQSFFAKAVAMGALMAASLGASEAAACGGFFCSQTQGVNQAAERIVFANNGDGTVTAVIEIQYQGPADKFSWLLPISSVPEGDDIAVASSISFQRLQQATNPQYRLTTRIEGECDVPPPDPNQGFGGTSAALPGGFSSAGTGNGATGPVTVQATGQVGSFEWAVISVDEGLPEPADAAVAWLTENGYDVPQGAPGLLGPYLEDGLYLLALRLQKGATAGSIRPIVLTYDAEKPMIPIKLTAVAANDDMGVMTWVLSDAQAVPMNYYGLELNEARINWFNANSNYNAVVTAAADDAGGQGFVTEYAQPGSALANVVWTPNDEQTWLTLQAQPGPEQLAFVQVYSGFDGFWDVFREHVTLPPSVTVEQVQACPFCGLQANATVSDGFLAAMEAQVIEPARLVQKLLDEHPYVTRLYSTLSAAEMTVDPLFSFNPDLEPISNVHTAERVIECGPGYYQFNAPWRIELPQGGVIRGGPQDIGQWPTDFATQPANRRILRLGESGPGRVVEDNGATIDAGISTYSASVPTPPTNPKVGAGGSSNGSGGTRANGADPNDTDEFFAAEPQGGGCGCRVGGRPPVTGALLALAGLGVLWRRRRRSAP